MDTPPPSTPIPDGPDSEARTHNPEFAISHADDAVVERGLPENRTTSYLTIPAIDEGLESANGVPERQAAGLYPNDQMKVIRHDAVRVHDEPVVLPTPVEARQEVIRRGIVVVLKTDQRPIFIDRLGSHDPWCTRRRSR